MSQLLSRNVLHHHVMINPLILCLSPFPASEFKLPAPCFSNAGKHAGAFEAENHVDVMTQNQH